MWDKKERYKVQCAKLDMCLTVQKNCERCVLFLQRCRLVYSNMSFFSSSAWKKWTESLLRTFNRFAGKCFFISKTRCTDLCDKCYRTRSQLTQNDLALQAIKIYILGNTHLNADKNVLEIQGYNKFAVPSSAPAWNSDKKSSLCPFLGSKFS